MQKLLEEDTEVSTTFHPGPAASYLTPMGPYSCILTHCPHTPSHPHTHTLSKVSLVNHQARLATEFESSPVKKVIENRLFRFLHYNSYHLPMYAKPDMI